MSKFETKKLEELAIVVAALAKNRNWSFSQRRRNRKLLLLLALYPAERRWWIRPIFQNRSAQGDGINLIEEMRLSDKDSFFNFFRMTPETFDELLSLVGPLIQKRDTNFRDSISPKERLAVALRFIASGDLMASLSFSFRMARSTVSGIVRETSRAISAVLQQKVLETPTAATFHRIAADFEHLWQFHHCLGALDGKHVAIQAPSNSGSVFYNYKNFFSIVLLAVCDAKYKFTVVDIGAPGSQSDGGIFKASTFGQALEAGLLSIPEGDAVTNSAKILPYAFVADAAFPLKPYLMRPYPGSFLTLTELIFNYRLSRARRCIENAFGIMAARFRIFHKPIPASLATCGEIVKAAVCLHNYLLESNPSSSYYCPHGYADSENIDGTHNSGLWRDEVPASGALTAINRAGSNMHSRSAADIRKEFEEFFCNDGAVPWQTTHVTRTA